MKRIYNYVKYVLTTDLVDLQITLLHILIFALVAIWLFVLLLVLPVTLIQFLFN